MTIATSHYLDLTREIVDLVTIEVIWYDGDTSVHLERSTNSSRPSKWFPYYSEHNTIKGRYNM